MYILPKDDRSRGFDGLSTLRPFRSVLELTKVQLGDVGNADDTASTGRRQKTWAVGLGHPEKVRFLGAKNPAVILHF